MMIRQHNASQAVGFSMKRAIGYIAVIWVMVAGLAPAQYTDNFQTNSVSGVINNWPGDYYVGSNYYHDVLMVTAAGVLNNDFGYLGNNDISSNNAATISGVGSVWSNAYDLYVGASGSGNTLTIANSGMVVNVNGNLGYYPGSD